MKRFFLSILFIFVVTALCGACHHGHCAEARFKILASTFPVYLFTLNVCAGANDVSIELLVPAAAGCPHDFSLKPGDLRKLTNANVLVVNGATLEDFLIKPLQTAGDKLPVIDGSKGATLLDGDDHDHDHDHAGDDHGHARGDVNPHLFAAPYGAAIIVKNIAAGLQKLDPQNAAIYAANAAAYDEKLRALSDKFQAIGKNAANKGIVLEHDALSYLARNAGLEIVATIDAHASAAELASVKKIILAKKPAALAGDSQYSDKLLFTLSRETDVPVIRLDPCASGSANPPLDYYQTIMEENLKILEKSFDGKL